MKKDIYPFGFEKPEDSPGFLLWQTTITWQRLIKKELDSYNINHSQFVIMAVIMWFQTKEKIANQTIIANLSKLDKMTVSKSLKKLIELGLIVRVEDKQDTRAKNVNLTDKGKKLITKLVPIVEKIDDKFFKKLNKSEMKIFLKFFNTLLN